MRNDELRLGFGIVFLVGGLAACTDVPRRMPSVTGAAGVTAVPTGAAGTFEGTPTFPPPSLPPTGADGGITCGADGQPLGGVAGGARGFPPTLPSTVTRAAKTVPAITGGTLLALAGGKTAVAADPDRDRIYVVDLDGGAVRSTVMLQEGDEPGRVIEDGAKRVHVALRRGGALVTLDPATGAIVTRRSVCSAPRGLAYQAAGDLIHVACAGGELVSLPATGGAATRTLTLDADLRDVVVAPGGKLLVSTFRRADVLVVGTDGVVGVRRKPQTAMANAMFGMPRQMSPSVAWRMVPMNDAQGNVMVLHQMGVDDELNLAAGGYSGLKGCSAIVEATVSVLGADQAPVAVPMAFEQVSLAVDVAVSPDGSRMALAVPGNALQPSLPSVVQSPTGSMMTQTVSGQMGCNFLGADSMIAPKGEVVSVSFSSNTTLLAQLREPAGLWNSATGTTISLSPETRLDTGHQLFHLNAGGGLACASCHPEGGEDGRVWKFACQGDRRTQSIRGNISGTAPFHWDGAETNFATLMDDVFVQRMAGPPLTPEQKTTLAQWIDTIPAMPVAKGLDAAAVERGKAVFNDAQVACATCHAGALTTNNTTVDVGTGHMLQVPSLRGVSWRTPLMHNGCAATLADRFSPACGGGDKHGKTSQLTAAQLGDLTTYLQSL